MMRPLLILCASATISVAAEPNVLFIAVDDLRPDLGAYGESHMITPHMDRLAAEGRLFRNHYVSVPTCGASRYAMLTGLRPTTETSRDNDSFDLMPTSLPTEPESWVDLLRRNGWHTASIGKVTHEPDGYRWNFPVNYDSGRSSATWPDMRFSWNEIIYDHDTWGAQIYPLFAYAGGIGRVRNSSPAWEIGVDAEGNSLPDEAYPDGQMAQAAIAKLREFADDRTRFCLAVGFHKPHLPFNAPKAYWDLYPPEDVPGPVPAGAPAGASSGTVTDSTEINKYTQRNDRDLLRRAYYASVSYLDAQVGKVLDELDALGLADNTIVVLWGDHGFCLDDYGTIGKHKVLERSLESPLIIRPPVHLRPAAYAGLHAEGVVETLDIYPTIAELCGLSAPASADGESLVPMLLNPFALGKNHAYSRWRSLTTVRTSDWRLIRSGSNLDLYDLSSFRYELQNVAASHPAVVAELNDSLTVQGTRPGLSYAQWAADNPLLADPFGDADQNGVPNAIEYAAGTDPLDAQLLPVAELLTQDLSAIGLSDSEIILRFRIATDADDFSLLPSTSTDLQTWSIDPLEFLDATDLGGNSLQLRFRLTDPGDPTRFFRLNLQPLSGNE